METFFRVTGEFPAQRPVTRSVAGDLRRHRAHYDCNEL